MTLLEAIQVLTFVFGCAPDGTLRHHVEVGGFYSRLEAVVLVCPVPAEAIPEYICESSGLTHILGDQPLHIRVCMAEESGRGS